MDHHPEPLLEATRELNRGLANLRFGAPVHTVYAPLTYAWCGFRAYIQNWSPRRASVLFLGMNPGPFGMAQTGVPFGEVRAARDWLGIDCPVQAPDRAHPKRPIQGFGCARSEVSGARLWGLFRDRFGTPEAFFRDHFVANYCPLMFVEPSGRNRTPDKLPAAERDPLLAHCDRHLLAVVEHLRPRWLVGVGAFAMRAAQRAVRPLPARDRPGCVQILHPSPASRGQPRLGTGCHRCIAGLGRLGLTILPYSTKVRTRRRSLHRLARVPVQRAALAGSPIKRRSLRSRS